MKLKKSMIILISTIFLIVSAIGPAFADLYIDANPNTAHVNDTVTITVITSNDGINDWYPALIYTPIPDGLKYVSYDVQDRSLQNYDPDTGIWNVNRMPFNGKGYLKSLIITTKVMPEAAGKTLTLTARYQQLIIENTNQDITNQQASARPDTVTIIKTNDITNTDGPNSGSSSGSDSGNGSGSGSSDSSANNPITDTKTPTANTDNSAVNTGTIGMQNTGTPMNYVIISILAVFSGFILPRIK